VTHDQEEAMIVADRIAVMNHGRLIQVAPPAEIYERPCSRWVAGFIGEVNLIEGNMNAGGSIDTALGQLRIVAADRRRGGDPVSLALRPEKISVSGERPNEKVNALRGTVFEIGYRGDMSIYKLRLADRSVMKVAIANTGKAGKTAFAVDDLVWLSWLPEAGVVLVG
ncbi:MAG TPA: TOBE domain-containing protein, partial [Pseudolabrys sp.]|nr:TOBE domain-containing protein [Pseudolabrys sp.]